MFHIINLLINSFHDSFPSNIIFPQILSTNYDSSSYLAFSITFKTLSSLDFFKWAHAWFYFSNSNDKIGYLIISHMVSVNFKHILLELDWCWLREQLAKVFILKLVSITKIPSWLKLIFSKIKKQQIHQPLKKTYKIQSQQLICLKFFKSFLIVDYSI